MDMVRLVKRLTHVRRVGHAGTLDPIAEGVLPICLGQATRVMEYILDGTKRYRAEFTLGVATDTFDADGQVVEQGDWSQVTRSQVEALLPTFVGTVQQQPPAYSALKHEGKRLYELARAGVEVERPTREVTLLSLTLLDWSPPRITVEAECGRGFYMRTLAHDLGTTLGCNAHLSALTRLRAGPFRIEESVTVQRLGEVVERGEWEELLEPPDVALLAMPSLALEPAAEGHLRNGQTVTLRWPEVTAQHMEGRRAYSADGRFLGVVRFNRAQGHWQPVKLFDLPVPSSYAP